MKPGFTKGQNKILLQFKRFAETEQFLSEVSRIREILKIPPVGIECTEEDLLSLGDTSKLPRKFPIDKFERVDDIKWLIRRQMEEISKSLPVNCRYLRDLVQYFIIFNKWFYEDLDGGLENFQVVNVCELTTADDEFSEYGPSDDPEQALPSASGGYPEWLYRKLRSFPVVLRIHSDASQRDVIEYIKKNWDLIKEYQDLYIADGIGTSFRNSKTKEDPRIKERNQFIYDKRNLSRKEIMQMVNRDFGADLDQGSIGKIISLEKKKREKK